MAALTYALTLCLAALAAPLSENEIAQRLKLYRDIATLKTTFHQVKTLKDLNVKLESSGNLTLVRPDKVVWEVVRPAKLRLVVDKQVISMEADGKKEMWEVGKRVTDDASRSFSAMLAWLKIDVPAIQRLYAIESAGPNEFRATPKAAADSLFSGLVMKLHTDGYLEKLMLEEKSGDSITITFTKPALTRVK